MPQSAFAEMSPEVAQRHFGTLVHNKYFSVGLTRGTAAMQCRIKEGVLKDIDDGKAAGVERCQLVRVIERFFPAGPKTRVDREMAFQLLQVFKPATTASRPSLLRQVPPLAPALAPSLPYSRFSPS